MIEIIEVPIDELKPSEYNPRKASEKEAKDLEQSIVEFGFVEPILANSAPERKNIIIGGHFRWRTAKELGFKTVPVIYRDIPDIEKEKALNFRLNKNTGSFDWDELANFDKEFLIGVGFEEAELMKNFGISDAEQVEVDEDRMMVITVETPEAPRIFSRQSFYFENIEEFEMVRKFFEGVKDGRLDVAKLTTLVQEKQ